MGNLHKTALNDRHVKLGANMVGFAGWEMPLHYEAGIVQEHLATRKEVGLFDISHMGRFIVRGKDAIEFLQHVLTNNTAALEEEEGHYTMIPNENGGVIDDAYLYRFVADEYILVVNASNREKDFAHLEKLRQKFGPVELSDRTKELAMLSLQGPQAKDILLDLISSGRLPEPLRNFLSTGCWSPAPATPANRFALSFSSSARMWLRSGTCCWTKACSRSAWVPETPCDWRPSYRYMGMSWGLTRRAKIYRPMPACWRGLVSAFHL
jgi:hypothetical protein